MSRPAALRGLECAALAASWRERRAASERARLERRRGRGATRAAAAAAGSGSGAGSGSSSKSTRLACPRAHAIPIIDKRAARGYSRKNEREGEEGRGLLRKPSVRRIRKFEGGFAVLLRRRVPCSRGFAPAQPARARCRCVRLVTPRAVPRWSPPRARRRESASPCNAGQVCAKARARARAEGRRAAPAPCGRAGVQQAGPASCSASEACAPCLRGARSPRSLLRS